MLGAGVVPGGELVGAGDHVRLVEPAEALAGVRVGLAGRRADQPPDRRELLGVKRGDVGFDPLMPGGARRRAGPAVDVDAERRVAELAQALVPAAGAGEEVDDPTAQPPAPPPVARKRAT